MSPTTYPKPRVRPIGPHAFKVDFGTGTAEIRKSPDTDDWWYETPDHPARHVWGPAEALALAWSECMTAPAPLAIKRNELTALISSAKDDTTACAKLMRRLLKLRTGIAWSVTCGRGTSGCWLRIHVPKARKVDSDGQPTSEDWGYMGTRDRALLGVILGEVPHHQGESIRTEAGVRESYLWRIAGHDAPADLVISEPSWD